MSISATSNYMSNADIMVWMQEKTSDLYGNMSAAMQGANRNDEAEAALNKIRGDLANSKLNGGDGIAIHDEVNDILAKYRDITGVADALQPIADSLNAAYATPQWTERFEYGDKDPTWGTPIPKIVRSPAPPVVKISSDEVDTWTKSIDNTVSDLGKTDQLTLINIQELNSQINQAKQTASALMDSANKSCNDIISHIG